MSFIPWIVLSLIAAKLAVQLWLEHLNRSSVLEHQHTVPPAFQSCIDPVTYGRSVEYSLAKIGFHQVELLYSAAWLLFILFSGILPWSFAALPPALTSGAAGQAAYLLLVAVGVSLTDLPTAWYAQFRLEQRFGFNTSTPRLWWTDRIKGMTLSLLLGFPVLLLILKLFEWTAERWWIYAWASVLTVQFVVLLLAPVLILPLFNKLEPLPEGSLRVRLLRLADRARFRAQSIQVMDGSKRSRHSNAFFTGFGRFRKIVLFDTLIQHLAESELEAVLAHEIGHYRKRHILKGLGVSALSLLLAFYVLAQLSSHGWLNAAFGFLPQQIAPTLLLFALLSGIVTFWLGPLANAFSRRFEFEADRFAADTLGTPVPLRDALRKLHEKNLSNLTPHPAYSRFYYSHPTLPEREAALVS